jgi:hypothetical protein
MVRTTAVGRSVWQRGNVTMTWSGYSRHAEVAELFKVDPLTVTRWAVQGRIGSVRTLGGHTLVQASRGAPPPGRSNPGGRTTRQGSELTNAPRCDLSAAGSRPPTPSTSPTRCRRPTHCRSAGSHDCTLGTSRKPVTLHRLRPRGAAEGPGEPMFTKANVTRLAGHLIWDQGVGRKTAR